MGTANRGSRVLILGGTSEARQLADLLVGRGVRVTSSLAGRVQNPALPVGEVRIGGFGGRDGLASWLVQEQVAVLVDATHPFAARITESAVHAARITGVPLLGLRRPGWTEAPGQEWHRVTAVAGAAMLLRSGLGDLGTDAGPPQRVFLTTGRLDLAAFTELTDHWFLIRTVDPPTVALPRNAELLLARGPYTFEGERDLMHRHRIDVLVTKDSGGAMTEAKLLAACELGVTVIMVDRPAYPLGTVLDTPAAAADWVSVQLAQRS